MHTIIQQQKKKEKEDTHSYVTTLTRQQSLGLLLKVDNLCPT